MIGPRQRFGCLFLVAAIAILAPIAARAHEARPAYLELKETTPGEFSVLWRTLNSPACGCRSC